MWLTDKIKIKNQWKSLLHGYVHNDERQVNINNYSNAERNKQMGKKVQGVGKASWKLQG